MKHSGGPALWKHQLREEAHKAVPVLHIVFAQVNLLPDRPNSGSDGAEDSGLVT